MGYNNSERYPRDELVSLLFGGVGDARHPMHTIREISKAEEKNEIPNKRYHVTINDIHKCALARDIIIFILLEKLATMHEGSDETIQVLNTLFFLYVSILMPSCAYKQLQDTITAVLSALKTGEQPSKLLYLHAHDMPSYVEALESWQGKAQGVLSNAEAIQLIAGEMIIIQRKKTLNFFPPTPEHFRREKDLYCYTALVCSAQRILETEESTLRDLL